MSQIKVTVLGAAGGIGQPLSLLLKLNRHVTDLALYDVVNVPGLAADLAHIDTDVKVHAYMRPSNKDEPNEALVAALEGAHFVIIPAGIPRKPGMTRGDLFNINAGICAELADAIAKTCPQAVVLVISNPVNSTVPIFKEILSKHGVFDPKRLLGITALDHVRANTFVSELVEGSLPQQFNVPVIGGHSGHSIVPLFSQLERDAGGQDDGATMKVLDDVTVLDALVHRVQYGGDEVVEAKNGNGSSTLSMAYAANRFFNIILDGYLNLDKFKISSYMYLDDSIPGVAILKSKLKPLLKEKNLELPTYFATPMTYDENGIENVDSSWVDRLNADEREMLYVAVDFINQNIEKGVEFVCGD